jgi:hypothetical protein
MRTLLRNQYALILAVNLTAAVATPTLAQPVNPYPGYESEIYADAAHWLCRPDMDDACDHDFDATVVWEGGVTQIEPWQPAAAPAIDCFYLYPTISMDETGNSDFIPGEDEETFVVRQQAARLGSTCRMFAPIYRQVTLTALLGILGGTAPPFDSALADADILDAWKHYIANDNGGRGVVLIGHSQGASRLVTLIQSEIDPSSELRDRLVSAILLGTSFQVPEGADVGGDFANIPLCHSGDDIGCVISYASFRSTVPPPTNSRFGRSRQAGWKAACTNPALLAHGANELHPYFPTNGQSLPLFPVPDPPPAWLDPSLDISITTPFVTLPAFIEAECREHNGFSYLEITVYGATEDPRIDDIGGDLSPDWGLHLVDANIAMGDLVAIAERQAQAYQSSHQSTGGGGSGCAITAQRRPSAAVGLLLGTIVLLIARRYGPLRHAGERRHPGGYTKRFKDTGVWRSPE